MEIVNRDLLYYFNALPTQAYYVLMSYNDIKRIDRVL